MNILFVCNGNVARSQEAEAFFNATKSNPQDIGASGGINTKLNKPIDPLVVEVMAEVGYDLSSAQRKFVSEAMAQIADKIISFKPVEELPDFIKGHSNIEHWPVPDPQHQPIEFHRQVRDDIRSRVASLLK